MKSDRKKPIILILYICPFILGVIGYLQVEEFNFAVYDAIKLYGMSINFKAIPNWMLAISMWWAPAMTITAIISAVANKINNRIETWGKCQNGAMAVYGDGDIAELIASNDDNGIFCEADICKNAKLHIIAFSDDNMNLSFYRKHRLEFENNPVYILLRKINRFLLSGDNDANLYFLDVDDVISREFWISYYSLQELIQNNNEIKLAIIGRPALTDKMLYFGLLNNIYKEDQAIEYNVWGLNDSSERKYIKYAGVDSEINDSRINDRIILHSKSPFEDIDLLKKYDRIILTDENDYELAELIMAMCPGVEIYWFNPHMEEIRNLYDSKELHSFGDYRKILSREHIHRASTFKSAEQLHERFRKMYELPSWNEISAFMREDNVCAMDYNRIRCNLIDSLTDVNEDDARTMCVLEHVRWQRFRYLHGWSKGMKDNKLKTHPDLVKFSQLKKGEQYKDAEVISIELECALENIAIADIEKRDKIKKTISLLKNIDN